MSNELEYIVKVFKYYEIPQTWVVGKLGKSWTKARLNRILNNAGDIYTSDYHQLKTLLDKHNFVLPSDMKQNILEETATLNRESADLVVSTVHALEDGLLSEEELADALLAVSHIEQRTSRLRDLLIDQRKERA